MRPAPKFEGAKCRTCGGTTRYVSNRDCVSCQIRRNIKWEKTHPNKNKREWIAQWRRENVALAIFQNVRWRAGRTNVEFTITEADIKIEERCPICGTRYEQGKIAYHAGVSRSVDRLDNSKGYIPGNVAVICNRCNVIKNDATIERLRQILAWWEDQLAKKT